MFLPCHFFPPLFWQCWGFLLLFFSLFYSYGYKNVQDQQLAWYKWSLTECHKSRNMTLVQHLFLYLFSFHSHMGNNYMYLWSFSKIKCLLSHYRWKELLQSSNLTNTIFQK
jgi:hypothetical protein